MKITCLEEACEWPYLQLPSTVSLEVGLALEKNLTRPGEHENEVTVNARRYLDKIEGSIILIVLKPSLILINMKSFFFFFFLPSFSVENL